MKNSIFMNFAKKNRKYSLIFFDVVVIFMAYFLSEALLCSGLEYSFVINTKSFLLFTSIATILYIIVLLIVDVYSNITRYENGSDYLLYILYCIIACFINLIISKVFTVSIISIKQNLIACVLIIIGLISYRILIRIILSEKEYANAVNSNNIKTKMKNVLIIGAGSAARDIIKTIKSMFRLEYNIVGIIDDNINKLNYSIAGVKIIGNREKIEEICQEMHVDTIFFTISEVSLNDKRNIIDRCQKTGAKIRVLQSTENAIKNKNLLENLRDLSIEDVLYREEIRLDNNNIENLVKDKVILITGGGGSIGSELCRQIIKRKPAKLVILDIYENNLYDIQMELKSEYPDEDVECIVASVRDVDRIEYIWKTYKPEIVFHAAAHKHVPLMEYNPIEAIKNNVFGTYNVANCCDKFNTSKCILISTDKAVNPTNVMGATKRLCEMIVQAKNKISKTDFVAVRFGNVLGSNGSVIPLFKKQIENGGPVTVTNKEITRFFMTIPEAVGLVLQASTFANGGEIFVLDMGKPVKIYELAEKLIELSGLRPNIDIKIDIVGTRPGEKLYEELLMDEEGIKSTKHEKIFIAKPINISVENVEKNLKEISETIRNENVDKNDIKACLKNIVTTYVDEGGFHNE